MIDDIAVVLEECKMIFAELVLDGEIVTMDRLATGLATIAQLEQRLAFGDDDLDEDNASMATVDILTRSLADKKIAFQFADIAPEVLEAVYSACDSAEDNDLQGWEIDLIESRIVERHGGKKLLKSKG